MPAPGSNRGRLGGEGIAVWLLVALLLAPLFVLMALRGGKPAAAPTTRKQLTIRTLPLAGMGI